MKRNTEKVDDTKIKRLILTIVTIVLILGVVGITYALFNMDFDGNDVTATIEFEGGSMDITYIGGDGIVVTNVLPQADPVAVKSFTVVANNTHDNFLVKYLITLEISENTFSDNAIAYILAPDNETDGGSITVDQIGQIDLLGGSGSVQLAEGAFASGTDLVHSYTLSIYFPSRGVPQNEDQGKIFKARVITTSLP